jgi:hypothetical protein
MAGADTAPAALPARRLSVDKAAVYCNISPSYLNKLRVVGTGPIFIRLGRRISYDTRDLDIWLNAGRRRSTADIQEVA